MPLTTQVFELEALTFGLSSVPFHSQVLEEEAPTFGLISFPSHTQVFELDAPLFGFNSLPSHTQALEISMLLVMLFPSVEFTITEKAYNFLLSTAPLRLCSSFYQDIVGKSQKVVVKSQLRELVIFPLREVHEKPKFSEFGTG